MYIVIIDDDVYVWPSVMRNVVTNAASHGPDTAVGIPGCVSHGINGFCGGGGYAISKTLIDKMINHQSSDFMKEYTNHCEKTRFCDITTMAMLKSVGGKVIEDLRMHSWGMINVKHLKELTEQQKQTKEYDRMLTRMTSKLITQVSIFDYIHIL